MKKVFIIILNVTIALVGIYTALSFVGKKTRTENITVDTVWTGLSANKQFWKKLNIDDKYTIVYDGEKCVIGWFITMYKSENFEDPYDKFETKARFDVKHNMHNIKRSEGFNPDTYLCLDCFIELLNKAKETFIKYSTKCKEYNIKEHEQVIHFPYYQYASVTYKRKPDYYNKDVIDEYTYIDFNHMNHTTFKFKSVEEIDNWIQKIEEFKKNEFVEVKSLFE